MDNMDKARSIVERLNAKGAELGNASWGIVGQVLDEIDATNDPYMPTDAEWAAHPWAKFAATRDSGSLWLHDAKPEVWKGFCWQVRGAREHLLKITTPPADFRTTLRHRPEGI